jgi:hypothetical protein
MLQEWLMLTSVRGLFVEAEASSFPPVPLGNGTLDMSQPFSSIYLWKNCRKRNLTARDLPSMHSTELTTVPYLQYARR